jgi:hypothetical protein
MIKCNSTTEVEIREIIHHEGQEYHRKHKYKVVNGIMRDEKMRWLIEGELKGAYYHANNHRELEKEYREMG